MAAVGNLNDYVKYQMAQGFEKGGAGVGGIGAEMAVGMSMAQQMMNQPGGITAQTTPAARGAPAAPRRRALPETLGPADAAKVLGVSEADVIASLEAGDLKGKKIGTQWRITQTRASPISSSSADSTVSRRAVSRTPRPDDGRDRPREVPLPGVRRRGATGIPPSRR